VTRTQPVAPKQETPAVSAVARTPDVTMKQEVTRQQKDVARPPEVTRKQVVTPAQDVTILEDATGVVPAAPQPAQPIAKSGRDDGPIHRTPAVWREPSDATPPPPWSTQAHPAPLPESNGARSSQGDALDRRQRQLRTLVGVLGALVVLGLIGIIVANVTGSSSTPPARVASNPSVTAAPPTTGSKSTTHHKVVTSPKSTSRSSKTTQTTQSTLPSTPGAAPVISSISPASGAAGTSITVSGANFMSSSGQIVAKFDGQVAPTSCPELSTCTVTVPTLPAGTSGSVPFTITTDSGTTSPKDFTYQ
jgi:hypothetical protein